MYTWDARLERGDNGPESWSEDSDSPTEILWVGAGQGARQGAAPGV